MIKYLGKVQLWHHTNDKKKYEELETVIFIRRKTKRYICKSLLINLWYYFNSLLEFEGAERILRIF